MTQLSASFNNLPKSNYLDGDYRLRRYSHFNFSANVLKKMPAKAFEQSAEFNDFQGNVARQYEDIEQDLIDSEAFFEIFSRFKDIANLDDEANIEVHQIRIIAGGEQG
ncbi:MAG: 2OG-Fe dioxygenase family protein, partial [Gammaproteobacteria bacterium]